MLYSSGSSRVICWAYIACIGLPTTLQDYKIERRSVQRASIFARIAGSFLRASMRYHTSHSGLWDSFQCLKEVSERHGGSEHSDLRCLAVRGTVQSAATESAGAPRNSGATSHFSPALHAIVLQDGPYVVGGTKSEELLGR